MTEPDAQVHPRNRGFTLVELMITVAIVGILAAIAYPSYVRYVIRSNRTDAQKALLQMAQEAERFFTQTNAYDGFDPTNTGAYAELTGSGRSVYTLDAADSVLNQDQTYVIVLEPDSAKANKGDGDLEIRQDGTKIWHHPDGDKNWNERN